MIIHHRTPHAEVISGDYNNPHIIVVRDRATGLNIIMEYLEDGKVQETFNSLKDAADVWQGFPANNATPTTPPTPASQSEINTLPSI